MVFGVKKLADKRKNDKTFDLYQNIKETVEEKLLNVTINGKKVDSGYILDKVAKELEKRK